MEHDHRPPHHHGQHYSVSNHRGSYKDSGSRATMVKGVSLRSNFSMAGVLAHYGVTGSSASLYESIPGGISLFCSAAAYGIG